MILCLALIACSVPALFPAEVMKDVEKNFDFNAWRATPSAYLNQNVQLGGRILDAQATDEGTMIVAKQLPIVEHPAYGPSDSKKRPGSFEFTLLYRGKLDTSALMPGNRFIVVGTTRGAKPVTVDGSTRSAPSLIARCVHIWKTGGRDIADFQSSGAGYEPLEEATYCLREASPPKP
jgi:starvation-inducible outer membrane lipoprotein